ncbi:hypothetical protein R6Q59_010547 [Mikania micrantha]
MVIELKTLDYVPDSSCVFHDVEDEDKHGMLIIMVKSLLWLMNIDTGWTHNLLDELCFSMRMIINSITKLCFTIPEISTRSGDKLEIVTRSEDSPQIASRSGDIIQRPDTPTFFPLSRHWQWS